MVQQAVRGLGLAVFVEPVLRLVNIEDFVGLSLPLLSRYPCQYSFDILILPNCLGSHSITLTVILTCGFLTRFWPYYCCQQDLSMNRGESPLRVVSTNLATTTEG